MLLPTAAPSSNKKNPSYVGNRALPGIVRVLKVGTRSTSQLELAMITGRELRARAVRCLEIAQQMTDSRAANYLRQQAQDYHAMAVELETGQPSDRPVADRRMSGG